jgi:hypothetical protein
MFGDNTHLNTRKRLVLLSGFLVISAFILLIAPAVFADSADKIVEALEDTSRWLQSSTEMIKDTFFDNSFFKTMSYSVAVVMMNVIATFAASLFVVYVIIYVIRESLQGEIRLDSFLNLFVKMGFTLFLISNCNTITNAIHKFMGDVATYISGAIQNATYVQVTQIALNVSGDDTVSYSTYFKYFALARVLLLLMILIMLLVVKVTSYALLMELCIRKMFMPLAVLSVMEPSRNGMTAGGRYIKKYIATYVNMMIYIIAFAFGDMIANVTLGTMVSTNTIMGLVWAVIGYVIEWLIIEIAALNFANESALLSEEIVGI